MGSIVRNVILGITLAAPLGPAGVAIIQTGFRQGFLRAFVTGIGVTMADTTYLLVVYFGLSSYISLPMVKITIWTLGALVLIYLGIQSLREARRRMDLETTSVSTSRNPLLVGYVVNISNPIAIVWWVGIFGSLLGASTNGVGRIGALVSGSTILIGILSWHSMVSLLTHWGKRFLNEKTARYISVIAGIALIMFGLRFAYYAARTVFGSPGV